MKDYNLANVTHVLIDKDRVPVLQRVGRDLVLVVLPLGLASLPCALRQQAREWRGGFKTSGGGSLVALYVHGVPLLRLGAAAK